MKRTNRFVAAAAALMLALPAYAAKGPAGYLKRPDTWFSEAEAGKIAANILAHQSTNGGWPKNIDTTTAAGRDGKQSASTFDNGATVDELRFLARMFRATREPAYAAAFDRGLDLILKAQYPGGGWPQCHPPPRNYQRHVTFNDNVMVNLMNLLREIARDDLYDFVEPRRRAACEKAFSNGIRCILKCQIVVDGKPAGWCAQHDETSFEPRPGRAYELVSLSGCETVGIVRLLMSLDEPDAATKAAIAGAVDWLDQVKITGRKVVEAKDDTAPGGVDKRLVEDSAASPLWARFYEIGTNRPIFCGRDGVIRYGFGEIEHERRNGYAWFGAWPQKLIEKEYPKWRESQPGKSR
jgi:PelA/Pel-15E family pectate lyase